MNGARMRASGYNGNSSQRNGRRHVSDKEGKRETKESASSTEVSASKPDERRHDHSVMGGRKREAGIGANAEGDKPDEISSATRRFWQPPAAASSLVRDYFLGSGATRSSGWEGDPLSSSEALHAGEPGADCNGKSAGDKISEEGTTFGGLSSGGKGTSAMGCSGGSLGSAAAEGVGVLKEGSVRQRKRSTLSLKNSRGESLQRTLERVMEVRWGENIKTSCVLRFLHSHAYENATV